MKVILYEYNVTPIIEKKDVLSIKIEDCKITYNGKQYESIEKENEVNNLLLSCKEKLLKLKNIEYSSYKGGRQEELRICYEADNKETVLMGNTSNAEISKFYNDFKNRVISILDNN